MIKWRAEINTPVSVFAFTSTFQLCRFWLACLLIWTICWQIVFNLGCKTCYRAKKNWIVRAFSFFFFFALKRVSFFRVVKGWRFHRLLSFGSVLYETISINRFWLFCFPSEFETTRRTSSFINKGLWYRASTGLIGPDRQNGRFFLPLNLIWSTLIESDAFFLS